MPEFPKAADGRMKMAPFLRTARAAVLVPICAAASPVSWANAQTFGSTYTSTAPKDCRVTRVNNGVDDSTVRVCPGESNLVVVISEGDLRETVSVGRNRAQAAREPAAQSWFGPFNSTSHTVE